MKFHVCLLVALVASLPCVTSLAGSTSGPVRPPLTLPQLEKASNVIFKGTVFSSVSVKDEAFKDLLDYEARETTFNVISILKGKIAKRKRTKQSGQEPKTRLIRSETRSHRPRRRTELTKLHRRETPKALIVSCQPAPVISIQLLIQTTRSSTGCSTLANSAGTISFMPSL